MDSATVKKHTDIIQRKLQTLKKVGRAAFKAIAVGGAIALGVMGLLTKGVIQTGMEFEKFGVQLKVLFGSVEAAESKFAWIKKFATTTPFELPQVVDATVKLAATGLSAETVLRDLGDLAAAAQKPLQQVVMAVSNIASGMLGIGMKQLRLLNINNKMMEEQGIIFNRQGGIVNSSGEVIAALQKVIQSKFSGMMEEQARTMAGVITNIKDIWTQFQALIAETINPVIKKDLEKIRDWGFEALGSGELKDRASAIGEKVLSVYTKMKKLFGALKDAAVTFWKVIGPPIKWMIDNPNMVKTAAIIFVMSKLVMITWSWVTALKSAAIVLSTKVVAGATKAVAGISAARLAGGMGVGAMGAAKTGLAAAGTASVAGSGASVAAAVGSAIPIVLGVLAAAAVGYGIYRVWKAYTPTREKSMSLFREGEGKLSEATKAKEKVSGLGTLLDEYTMLASKTGKTADEQSRYNTVMQDIVKILPEAKLRTNEYGEAVAINAAKVEVAVTSAERLYTARKRELELLKSEAITTVGKEAGGIDFDKYDALPENLDAIDSKLAILVSRIQRYNEHLTSNIQGQVIQAQRSIGSAKREIENIEKKQAALFEYEEKVASIASDLISLYSLEDADESTMLKFADKWGQNWLDQINKVLSGKGKVEGESGFVALTAEEIARNEAIARSEEKMLTHLETINKRSEALESSRFDYSINKLSEYDQQRRRIQRDYLAFVAKINKDETVLEEEKQKAIGQASGFRGEALAFIAEKERANVAKESADKIYDIERELAERRKATEDSAFQVSIAYERQLQQQKLSIRRIAAEKISQIEALVRSNEINAVDGARLISREVEQSKADEKLAIVQEYLSKVNEIEELSRASEREGYQIDFDYKRELMQQIADLEIEIGMSSFNNFISLQDAKLAYEKVVNSKRMRMMSGTHKIQLKAFKGIMGMMHVATSEWAAGDIKLKDAVAKANIRTTADMVAHELEVLGKKWSIEAIAAAASYQWTKAAGLAAAAVAAGAGASFVRSQAEAIIERTYSEKEDRLADITQPELGGDFESAGSRSLSSYTTRGPQTIYIQPSIAFTAETMIIGDTGLEEAGEILKRIAVQGVKEALETGEITLGE
jgi:phage tail tape-measure protein